MSEDIKPPPSDTRVAEQDPFLDPPGQPGSLMDKLAAAQGWLPGLAPPPVLVRLQVSVQIVLSGGRDDRDA